MAIKVDRVELADIANPKELATTLLAQLPALTLPIPVEDIALACGIKEINPLKTAGFEGMLLTSKLKRDGLIFVNAHNHPLRRRFTVGHELGHFLNPWHEPPPEGFRCTVEHMLHSDRRETKDRMQMEAEANTFAAEVLMPKRFFLDRYRAAGGDPTIQVLIRVADDFLVSKLAAARRLIGFRRDVATVLSRGGLIEQLYRGDDFTFISLKPGQAVPRASLTHQHRGDAGSLSAIEETDPATWTTAKTRKGALFLEQVLIQRNAFRLTLLVLDESACEEEEDGEDDEARWVGEQSTWNPTFHRSRRK